MEHTSEEINMYLHSKFVNLSLFNDVITSLEPKKGKDETCRAPNEKL